MKDDVVASISGSLLPKELCINLKLSEQNYVILIPKSLLLKHGITSESFVFDLVIKNQIMSLLGTESKQVKQLPGKEAVTWVTAVR